VELAAFTGAYSYLHRQVPLLYRHQPCDEAKAANYLIAKANDKHVPEEFKLVRRRGQYALFRREGGCDAPPADHDDMLDGADDMGLTRAPVRQPDRRELRIKAGTSSAAFVQGFGNGEHVECRNARWATARVSTLAFELEPAGGAYEFSFAARPFWRTMPQSVQIALNGKRLEDFELEEGWESYQVPVPPSVLQRGRNVMEFRFARTAKPGTEDQRDLAVLFDQVVLTPVATEVSIDAGSPAARVNLGSGFSGDESDGARSYVWSNAERSELRFTLGGPSVPHVLQFEGAAYRPIAPLNVSVAVNGKPAGDVLVPARWTQSTLLLGAGLIQPGVNEISLAYQSTARPVDREPPAGDSRQLAVMYDRVKIAALPKSDLCDIGSPEARAQMLSGWSVDEREEERTFSWNDGGSSTLAIYSPDATDAARALKVTHQAFQAVVPVHVRVKVNGRFIGAFEASSRWETSELPIPGDQHWTGTALVEFSYDKSGRPSDSNPPSPDRRLLSVRFDRIELMEQVDQPDR
jgi:hypothetical protein